MPQLYRRDLYIGLMLPLTEAPNAYWDGNGQPRGMVCGISEDHFNLRMKDGKLVHFKYDHPWACQEDNFKLFAAVWTKYPQLQKFVVTVSDGCHKVYLDIFTYDSLSAQQEALHVARQCMLLQRVFYVDHCVAGVILQKSESDGMD